MMVLKDINACLFCPQGMFIFKKVPIFTTENWFVTENDFPYEGSVHHVLAVPKRHIAQPDELTVNEIRDFFGTVIPTMETKFGECGFTSVFRFGERSHTGATVEHLHFHFISGVKQSSRDHPPILAVVGFKKT
jgi:diadenosine tetraphosphate (Ap4A) HIT family hydrolase